MSFVCFVDLNPVVLLLLYLGILFLILGVLKLKIGFGVQDFMHHEDWVFRQERSNSVEGREHAVGRFSA